MEDNNLQVTEHKANGRAMSICSNSPIEETGNGSKTKVLEAPNNTIVDHKELRNSIDEEIEFRAEDIFSDLASSVETHKGKFISNEATQTSQRFGASMVDASAQTSQGLLGLYEFECKISQQDKALKTVLKTEDYLLETEQVVPELAPQLPTFLPPEGPLAGKRRLGLSKKARLNSLHTFRL